jgi:hypothetical protein
MNLELGPFIAIAGGILAEDKRWPKKQQHTAKRMFERLRDEHGFPPASSNLIDGIY